MDTSNEFSTSSMITGKAYASDYNPPTPTKMTTAISDMETAYTDAAGRAAGYTELYAGDVTDKTLTPGCYKWGTGLLISAGGVTISGAAADIWIFQIAQDLTVADGAIITLSGGAKATNIFWQVGGQTTIGTTAAMKGIILCQTQIAMNTGATLVGRALAQTAVICDANSITIPTDLIAPTVSSTVPINAATGVSINSAMTATFSEAMDPLTITTTTFTLKQGATSVSGTVTYSGTKATFRPAANLAPSTVYTATITAGAKDLVGNAMAGSHAWSFTTSAIVNPSTTGTVTGTVVDMNGDPIEGAKVSVEGASISDETDAAGGYSLADVPGGAQELKVTMDGYDDQVYDVEVAPDSTTTNPDIVLGANANSSNWTLPLLLLVALIVIAAIVAILFSRRKKPFRRS